MESIAVLQFIGLPGNGIPDHSHHPRRSGFLHRGQLEVGIGIQWISARQHFAAVTRSIPITIRIQNVGPCRIFTKIGKSVIVAIDSRSGTRTSSQKRRSLPVVQKG